MNYGSHGVTISSRIATAAAHDHAWGRYALALVDAFFGAGHCKAAVGHDITRARKAIKELNEPVVTKWRKQ